MIRRGGSPNWGHDGRRALPEFTDEGDLPPGVHRATLADVLERFGQGSAKRVAVADRLTVSHHSGLDLGSCARFVVFGSFVTAKDRAKRR